MSDLSHNLSGRQRLISLRPSCSFRLNVSRLHADWIVKSKDYATALEFDQLREVLAEPQSVFAGFNEAPIGFAPTCEL